jgi:hypothetical protein
MILSASSTTKTGRHDIAEILLKVALNTKNQKSIKSIKRIYILHVKKKNTFQNLSKIRINDKGLQLHNLYLYPTM